MEKRRERRVEPDGRIGVEQTHAVGTDHAHPVAADLVDQLLLQGPPVGADFRKTSRDDDQRLHAGGRAIVDDAEDRGGRNGDNRQIDAGGQLTRGPERRQAVDRGPCRFTGWIGPGKPAAISAVDDAAADAGRIARRADDRHGARREERTQRRRGREPAPLFGGRDASVGRPQRQLHLDVGVAQSDRTSKPESRKTSIIARLSAIVVA